MLFASRDKGEELPKLRALSTTGQEFSTDFPPVVHTTRASSSLLHFRDMCFSGAFHTRASVLSLCKVVVQ